MCFDFLYNFCVKISHCKKNCERHYQKCICSSCKVPVIVVRFRFNVMSVCVL